MTNTNNEAIQLFEDQRIRTAWNEDAEEWYGTKKGNVTDAKLSAIVEHKPVPMLHEYWFDKPAEFRI